MFPPLLLLRSNRLILFYQLLDQESLYLHQVTAHDGRAFAASQALQGGVSLDFDFISLSLEVTQHLHSVLLGMAWADTDLYHLGPVVVVQ